MTDISRRITSILREEAMDVEQYYIDEAAVNRGTVSSACKLSENAGVTCLS